MNYQELSVGMRSRPLSNKLYWQPQEIGFYRDSRLLQLENNVSSICQADTELSLAQQSLGFSQTVPEAVTDKCQRVVAKPLQTAGEWSSAAVSQAAKNPFIILTFSCPKFYSSLLLFFFYFKSLSCSRTKALKIMDALWNSSCARSESSENSLAVVTA